MTLEDLLLALKTCPLVASVQASEGSAVCEPETLARLAQASASQGVRLLRMQGAEAIRAGIAATQLPLIGLIKRDYPGSAVYITPTAREVNAIADTGAPIIALDATDRPRPNGERLADLIRLAHDRGCLVLADIDSQANATAAWAAGADAVSTTLAGYTSGSTPTGPDLDLVRDLVTEGRVVLAEGRYEQPWQVAAALQIGAQGVVVGGALNDPEKNTRRLLPAAKVREPIGAIDIGGTWLRFGVFSPDGEIGTVERAPNPRDRAERIDWIRQRVQAAKVSRLGVSTGGIVDPITGEVWTAKEYLMPDHIGLRFDEATFGVPTYAFGDGHATAWGHACLPRFAGRRVATLALGTGVGCGFVREGAIWCGRRGEYPRVNDLPSPDGATYEQLLGGFHLGRELSETQRSVARSALRGAVEAIRNLYFPDDIVIAGSVGLSEWLAPELAALGLVVSPFGTDAGLHGAAALALYPSWR